MGRFHNNFLDSKILWPICVWNKNLDIIMFKCGIDYQIDPLPIVYSNQHLN